MRRGAPGRALPLAAAPPRRAVRARRVAPVVFSQPISPSEASGSRVPSATTCSGRRALWLGAPNPSAWGGQCDTLTGWNKGQFQEYSRRLYFMSSDGKTCEKRGVKRRDEPPELSLRTLVFFQARNLFMATWRETELQGSAPARCSATPSSLLNVREGHGHRALQTTNTELKFCRTKSCLRPRQLH